MLRKRQNFLADPATHDPTDFDWANVLENWDVKYIDASVTSNSVGDGSSGDPWGAGRFTLNPDSNPLAVQTVANRRYVFVGDVRGFQLNVRHGPVVLDMRQATASCGMQIPFARMESMGSNVYRCVGDDLVRVFECAVSLIVNDEPYRGLSRATSINAARVQIRQPVVGDGTMLVRTPWPLQVGEVMGFVNSNDEEQDDEAAAVGFGGLLLGTPYYVVYADTWNSTNGNQNIRVSLTEGGAAVTFDAGQLDLWNDTDLNNISVSPFRPFKQFFTLHQLYSAAQVPNPSNLQPGEFAYAPWEEAVYWRSAAPMTASDEVIFTNSTQGAVSNYGDVSDIHVLGGTFYGATRGANIKGGENVSFWGTKSIGQRRAFTARGGTENFKLRYVWAIGCKYGVGNETSTDGEPGTSGRHFLVENTATWVHNHADRQPLMFNPQSTNSEWIDGCVLDSGLGDYGDVELPPQQIATRVTWGACTIDGGSNSLAAGQRHALLQDIYFAGCYGEVLKANCGSGSVPMDRVQFRNCVVDCRDMDPQMAKAANPIWAFARQGVTNVDVRNILILNGDLEQYPQASGEQQVASGGVSLRSNDGAVCHVRARGLIIYGGSGTDSTLYQVRNNSTADLSLAQLDTDHNFYCCPDVDYLYVASAVTGVGTEWTAGVNIVDTRAMPTTPGAVSPWAVNQFTNDAHSRVLTEAEMTELGRRLWSASGSYLGGTLPDLVLPAGLPVWLLSPHEGSQPVAAADVEVIVGAPRRRRLPWSGLRRQRAALLLSASQAAVFHAWFEQDADAGAKAFAAQVAGPDGLQWFTAQILTLAWEALPATNGPLWRATADLLLSGEPQYWGPTP